jgi:hypothetical protein
MSQPYGTLASFKDENSFAAALTALREEGFRRLEAYTPYAVEYAADEMPEIRSPIPTVMFLAGLAGAAGGFYLQWYAAHDYPLNVGGRPLASWPAFLPITFELTVLCAALCGVGALLFLARLPRLDHPVFSDPNFRRASQDRFFICIRSDDPAYPGTRLSTVLQFLRAESIMEVSG